MTVCVHVRQNTSSSISVRQQDFQSVGNDGIVFYRPRRAIHGVVKCEVYSRRLAAPRGNSDSRKRGIS
ncbi:hypothetical protein ACHAXS_006588 [Conticribra weissflogii]